MRLLFIILVLLFGLIMGFVGYSFHKETTEAQIKIWYVDRIKEVEVEKKVPIPEPYFVIQKVPVYVDRVKEVEVEKEVVRWRNIYPREFESLEQFKEWYEVQEFYLIIPSPTWEPDCDDYAERLQWVALQQGYSISCHLGPKENWHPNATYKQHMFNMVIIGNEMFFVEPIPGKLKIWKVGEKD